MAHFTDGYVRNVTEILHDILGGTLFFKIDVLEVPELLVAVLVTYEGIRDDSHQLQVVTWEAFLERMAVVKPDWKHFDRKSMEAFSKAPQKMMAGWEGRTLYFIRGGSQPDYWKDDNAAKDVPMLLAGSSRLWGYLVQAEVDSAETVIPPGRSHFREYESLVRIAFNFSFRDELRPGREQVRSEPENEGVDIRDLLFSNYAVRGFFQDLKQKYSATEIVVDAKNTQALTRDDLRQLYCYLKPALGLWGFIVCRAPQPHWVLAFNRTLFKNFTQSRGVLILSDDDLRRMITMANRGQKASEYLRDRMADFAASI